MLKKQKMEIRFVGNDWTPSLNELQEKEIGLKRRLMEAHRQISKLRENSDIDKAAMEKVKKAINDYNITLEELGIIIQKRRSGSI